MNQAFVATFLALSAGGIINSGYLFYQHHKKKSLICPLNHDCSVVTESKWNKTLFVRNEILGLLFFVFLFISMLYLILNQNLSSTLKIIILIATALGLFFSIFLVLLQKYFIKDYCFYCLISAIITLLIFLNSIYLFG